MANLDIGVSGLDALQRMQQFLDPALFAKAQKGGVSYAAKAVPPAVAKGITGVYNIASARVKQDISRFSLDSSGTSATIRFSRRPPTLTQFKPRPGTRGRQRGLGRGLGWGPAKPPGKSLTATIIRANGRQSFPGAFMTAGQNGNQLVLIRKGQKLVSLYGPSTGSIFLGNSSIGPQLRETVTTRIGEQYIKGFERVLDAAARGRGG